MSPRNVRVLRPYLNDVALADRFWRSVARGEPDACWLWSGSAGPGAYGQFYLGPMFGVVTAHRFAYALHTGRDPGALEVCHNCPGGDNPRCCNPAHLFAGTRGDNARDASRKGQLPSGTTSWAARFPRFVPCGSRHSQAKLSEAQVEAIRRLDGTMPQTEIAKAFGISQGAVSALLTGKTWGRALPGNRLLLGGCGHRGVHNGRARLNADSVRLIRRLAVSHTCAEIARLLEVSWSTVHLVLVGKTWAHVT